MSRRIRNRRFVLLISCIFAVLLLDADFLWNGGRSALERGLESVEEETNEEQTSNQVTHNSGKTEDNSDKESNEISSSTKKPTMCTFFEPTEHGCCGMSKKGHEDLLAAWEEAWQERGWNTKVLTNEDAMRHPDFEMVTEKMAALHINPYNVRCIWRWLAMASMTEKDNGAPGGGGWMSDYDAFPLNLDGEEGLRISKEPGFKSYSFHVPCIIHAPREAWDKVLHLMVDIMPDHGRLPGNDLVTDMYLLLHVYQESGKEKMGVTEWKVESVGYPYLHTEDLDDPRAVNCYQANQAKVAHFSHHDSARAYEKGYYPKLKDLKESQVLERRGEAALKVMKDYKEQCLTM